MKLLNYLVFLGILCTSVISYAQPAYSPEVRSEREMQWMKDSLHIKPQLFDKISKISLSYQLNMDKAAQPDNKNGKEKTQKKLMQKKDADLKALLNKEQYARYYRREKEIRRIANIQHPPGRQPM
jgi:hypothetical protein